MHYCLGLVWSANHYYSKYQIEKLRADKAVGEAEYQGKVIAEQAFNFSRFNQVAEYTGSLNSLLSDSGEKTVIKYREILHREKNCDFPVPADIANGVLDPSTQNLVNFIEEQDNIACGFYLFNKVLTSSW